MTTIREIYFNPPLRFSDEEPALWYASRAKTFEVHHEDERHLHLLLGGKYFRVPQQQVVILFDKPPAKIGGDQPKKSSRRGGAP